VILFSCATAGAQLDEWRTDYRGVATIDVPDSAVSTVASFVLEHGSSTLHAV
jgi:hypothetical protein